MYERFRKEILTKLTANNFSVEQLRTIATAIDNAAEHYTVSESEKALATVQDVTNELVQTYLAVKSIEGLSRKTLQNYKYTLDLFFGIVVKPPEKISANDIRLYLAKYKRDRNVSDQSLDKVRQMLSWFFAWCNQEGYIGSDPTVNIKRMKCEHKQRHALSAMELERLRYACDNPREVAMLEVLFSTACRVSELAGLKKSDVHEDGSVHLYGKGKKHRDSYLTAKARLAVEAYLATRNDESEYLFVTERAPHKGMQPKSFENAIDKIAKRAGVENVTPHVIRHTTATMALNNGMNITEVQRLLGHASVNTTMIYAEQSDEAVRNAHGRCLA